MSLSCKYLYMISPQQIADNKVIADRCLIVCVVHVMI